MLAASQSMLVMERTDSEETIVGAGRSEVAHPSRELAGVKWIRVAFCNLNNQVMSISVPVHRLKKVCSAGLGKPLATFQTPIMYEIPVPGTELGCVGEVTMIGDIDTVRVLPWSPDTAMVLAEFKDRGLKDSLSGSPSPFCPRSFLKKQLLDLKTEFGLEPVVGLEVEFMLFKGYHPETGMPVLLDDFMYCQDKSWGSVGGDCLTEIVDHLMNLGIEVYTFHAETAPGQYEISFGPVGMLRAADNILFIRSAIINTARKYGLDATMSPKLQLDQPGNGAHLHLSLVDGKGTNVFPDSTSAKKFSKVAESFIAGVLDHMGAIPAISMPSPNSYARVAKSMWAGYYICWGYENRECIARISSPPYGDSCNNVEFRPHDGAANPYLAFGAYMASGMDGMRRKLTLGPDMKDDPAYLPDSEIESLGLKPLPQSLTEALDNLAKDKVLVGAMGPDLYRVYSCIKRYENEIITSWPQAKQVHLFTQRY